MWIKLHWEVLKLILSYIVLPKWLLSTRAHVCTRPWKGDLVNLPTLLGASGCLPTSRVAKLGLWNFWWPCWAKAPHEGSSGLWGKWRDGTAWMPHVAPSFSGRFKVSVTPTRRPLKSVCKLILDNFNNQQGRDGFLLCLFHDFSDAPGLPRGWSVCITPKGGVSSRTPFSDAIWGGALSQDGKDGG